MSYTPRRGPICSNMHVCLLNHFSHVWLCETLWTVARQAPVLMGILQARRLEWVPCPPPRDLPNPKIQPAFIHISCIGRQFFNPSATWEAHVQIYYLYIYIFHYTVFFLREPEENVFQDSIKE